jgi:hypothetical protein
MNDTDPVPETPVVGSPTVVVDPAPPAVPKPVPKAGPQTFAGRHFGVLETRHPLNAVELRRRSRRGRTMPEYRICYVTSDDHIAVAPVRLCAKMIMPQSSMLRAYATAIVTSSGRAAD